MSSAERSGKKQKRASTGRRPYLVVAYLSLCLFLGLIGYMIYFQFTKSEALLNDPRNHRQEIAEESVVRGKILDRNGNVLAETLTDAEGNEVRSYPYGSLFAHTVGYARYGASGLESSENNVLVNSHQNIVSQIQDDLKGNKKLGDSLVTTLDANLQQAASDALGDQRGAAFVMDVRSGKVLADVSRPAFDPNTVVENWDGLIASEDGVFLNRATQGLYPPGSTFKTVTALAYLRKFGNFDSFHYNCTGGITLGNFTVHCAGYTAHGEESFADAMANSCNCAFAHMAAELMETEELRAAAQSLGFNRAPDVKVPATASVFTADNSTAQELVMQTGIGQGDTQATPMEMCMIAQAIANGGEMFEPQFVDRVDNADGVTIRTDTARSHGEVMTAEETSRLDGILSEVVARGTAAELSALPVRVAGKTGTAEYGNEGKAHSWFMGYTKTGGTDIAFCVLIEDGGSNGISATTAAGRVVSAWLEQSG